MCLWQGRAWVEWGRGAGRSLLGRRLQCSFCLQHRGEPSAAGRQARRHLLFQAAQRPGVLREVRRCRVDQRGRGEDWVPPASRSRHLLSPYPSSEKILKLAANISGDKLVSLGTCFGKFTKTHKFRLHITALDYLAPYAKVCVRVGGGIQSATGDEGSQR